MHFFLLTEWTPTDVQTFTLAVISAVGLQIATIATLVYNLRKQNEQTREIKRESHVAAQKAATEVKDKLDNGIKTVLDDTNVTLAKFVGVSPSDEVTKARYE